MEATNSPQPAAPDKNKLTFEAANRVIRLVQLEDIRFSAFSATCHTSYNEIPDGADVAFSNRFVRPVVSRRDDGFKVRTTLVFGLAYRRAEEEPRQIASVRATVECDYRAKDEVAEDQLAEDQLAHFSLCYCAFHAWGYWREFVQSSLCRFSLPPVTLPLFNIAMAPKMVQDHID